MDNYVLGIFWAIGRYSVDNGIKYFFFRHKERYYLDVVRQELGLKSSVFFAEHKGKPQYKLKVTGFDFARIEKLGWQPRFSEQRDYLLIKNCFLLEAANRKCLISICGKICVASTGG